MTPEVSTWRRVRLPLTTILHDQRAMPVHARGPLITVRAPTFIFDVDNGDGTWWVWVPLVDAPSAG